MVLALEEIDECRVIGGSLEGNGYQSSVLILLALSAQGINSSIAFRIAAIRVASRRRLVLPPVVSLKPRLNAHELRDGRMKLPPQKSNDVQTTFHLVFPELPPDSFSCHRGFLVSSIDQRRYLTYHRKIFNLCQRSTTTIEQDLEHLDIGGIIHQETTPTKGTSQSATTDDQHTPPPTRRPRLRNLSHRNGRSSMEPPNQRRRRNPTSDPRDPQRLFSWHTHNRHCLLYTSPSPRD